MNNRTVYLAGPIRGCTYKGCTEWRKEVTKNLAAYGITCFSPLRGRTYLKDDEVIKEAYPDYAVSTAKAIVSRDRFDCLNSSLLFVNLLGAGDKASLGTMFEIAWASLQHKPIVLVMEAENNIHVHPFVTELCTFWASNLDEGCKLVRHILLPEGAIEKKYYVESDYYGVTQK